MTTRQRLHRLSPTDLGILGVAAAATLLGLASLARAAGYLLHMPDPVDLPQFYVSALILRTAPGTSIYDVAAFARYSQSICGAVSLPPNYPPLVSLLFIPLSYLPYATAKPLWLIINSALTGLLILWAWHRLPAERKRLLVFAAGFVLLLPATTDNLFLGQINAIMAWLLLISAVCSRHRERHWEWAAGACLGLAGAIKLWPLLLAGFFLLRRRYRITVSGLIVFVALTAASILIVGPAVSWQWYGGHMPQYGVSMTQSVTPLNQSIWGVASRLFIGGTIGGARLSVENSYQFVLSPLLRSGALYWAIIVAYVLASVTVLVGLAWRVPLGRPSLDERALWAVMLGIITVLPFAWPHYAFLLILPFVTLLSDEAVAPRYALSLGAFCLLMALLHRFWAWLIPHPLTLSFVFLAEVTMAVGLLRSLGK